MNKLAIVILGLSFGCVAQSPDEGQHKFESLIDGGSAADGAELPDGAPTPDDGPSASDDGAPASDLSLSCGPLGRMLCSGICYDTTRDNDNCGACGNACDANHTCVSSVCKLNNGQGCTPDLDDHGNPCPSSTIDCPAVTCASNDCKCVFPTGTGCSLRQCK